jgi:TIR domain
MPVFISHRTSDKELAELVHTRLTNIHRIKCWLDSVDARSDPSTITQQILVGINSCTHLTAVVTPNTNGSWWEHYEVGVAEQGARAITKYTQLTKATLPEYLWHWPVIQTDSQIDYFAAIYKRESLLLENVKSAATKAANERATYTGTATSFHRGLKSLLGQS